MSKVIETDQAFIATLTPRQKEFFLKREADRAARLQKSLVDLARGVSQVSALNGETLGLVLEDQS